MAKHRVMACFYPTLPKRSDYAEVDTTDESSRTYRFRILALLSSVALVGVLLALVTLIEPVRVAQAAFSQASTFNGKIAFQSNRTTGSGVNNPEGDVEIFTMNPNGTNLTQLTVNSANDTEPAWSPIGTQLAFSSDRDGGDNYEVYTMNANGSNQTRLTNNVQFNGQPTWSPDGTQIAFTSARDGNGEVYKMNVDGSNETNLTNTSGFEEDGHPTWDPNGNKIAFASDRNGEGNPFVGDLEIFKMNTDGSKQTRLTKNNASDSRPDWSPNGKQIAFESDRDGDREVFTMRPNGKKSKNRTQNDDFDARAAWSPDGKQIAFQSDQEGDSDIFTMNADGSNQTNPDIDSAHDGDPDWQPASLPIGIAP